MSTRKRVILKISGDCGFRAYGFNHCEKQIKDWFRYNSPGTLIPERGKYSRAEYIKTLTQLLLSSMVGKGWIRNAQTSKLLIFSEPRNVKYKKSLYVKRGIYEGCLTTSPLKKSPQVFFTLEQIRQMRETRTINFANHPVSPSSVQPEPNPPSIFEREGDF